MIAPHSQDGAEAAAGGAGNGFAHLHLHTEYSLLDGGNRIGKLMERVKTLKMDAVAMTDHGVMFGAVEFYTKAKKAGVKPILGIEAYVAPGDRTEKKPTGIADGGFHLVLLAENQTGWSNLLKLSSDAFINGFYYKPRMDKSTLAQWSEGIIAINGHLGSSIAYHLLQYAQSGQQAHYDAAREEAIWHRDCFGANEHGEPCFYVEVQRHSVVEQERINPYLYQLADELELPVVADNDAHFMSEDDWDHHDTLCCISMGKLKEDVNRLHYSRDLYVKSPTQMAELFDERPEVIENAAKIAARCDVDLDFSANHAPVVKIVSNFDAFPTDSESALAIIDAWPCEHEIGSTEWFKAFCSEFSLEPFDETTDTASAEELKEICDGALRLLTEAGAVWRYGRDGVDEAKRERMDRELQILFDKLISAYFLIVWDFVNWGRQRGIPANARGSGVGTMVGFVLGLSNACPVEYGLLFERFTDPDRTEYPDIDIDLCQNGRGDVINYVREKYGHVAQIITFGRLKAKAAIKDVARVMGLSPGDGQRLSNLVPAELNITVDEALEKAPDFKEAYDTDPQVKKVVDSARALEDHARHTGVHAAGVVVATQPLDNIVPLCKASGSDDIVTQWDGPTCEKVGLLKMDFLGLRTLSTIELAKSIIEQTLPDEQVWRAVGRGPDDGGPHPLDLERLQYDDQTVLELFRRGDTAGVFQFESGGMRKLLVEMKPDRLEDLIAANALYRPGPMDLIPSYCARKHGQEEVPKVHEIVDDFTAETYGIMVYQEQVMQIVHGLGGIPLRAAYSLIKAISKKKHDVINAERPKFIEGAGEKGLAKKQAEELFDLILKFAGYGFNKSHSTGYAIIAYQTAYLKTYFPNQYMAAVLTYESQARKVEDWAPYLDDCRKTVYPDSRPDRAHVGIEVKPPDLNLSAAEFTVVHEENEPRDENHGHIRFGLGAVKNVGNAAIRAIMRERDEHGPYESIFNFCERVDLKTVNKATMEALVKCGAFDGVHGRRQRSAVLASIEDAVAAGQAAAADRAAGQMNFFGSFEDAEPEPEAAAATVRLPSVLPWDERTALGFEKDALGVYMSGHPLDPHEAIMQAFATPCVKLKQMPDDAEVVVGGFLARTSTHITRSGRSAGQKMARLTIEDKTAAVDGVAFAESYGKFGARIEDDAIVFLVGRVDHSRGDVNLVVDKVFTLDEAATQLAGAIEIFIAVDDEGDAFFTPKIEALAKALEQARARARGGGVRLAEVRVRLRLPDGSTVRLKCNGGGVPADAALMERLDQLVGEGSVRVTAGRIPISEKDNRRRFRRAPAPTAG